MRHLLDLIIWFFLGIALASMDIVYFLWYLKLKQDWAHYWKIRPLMFGGRGFVIEEW